MGHFLIVKMDINYIYIVLEKGNGMEQIKRFLKEEDGIGVVEVILILVVLIALVAIFKTQITELVNNIFQDIKTDAGNI